MPQKRTLLITYKLSPSNLQRIESLSPHLDIRYAPEHVNVENHLPDAEILFGSLRSDELVLARRLRWVHLAYAGVDRMLFPEFVKSEVVLTSSKGIHKHQMTELFFGMMLTFTRKLRTFERLQVGKSWDISPYREMELLRGKTIGILGLGSIGSVIAKVASSFGMRVIGLRKNPSIPVEHVDVLVGPGELHQVLVQSDHIVIALPLTAETNSLITRREFNLMKQKPYFYNLARGTIVNEADLIDALTEGKIRGAGLDVFSDEPLDQASPLWEMQNVIITPHIGGFVPHYMREAVGLLLENLKRYLKGEELLNIVDKERGY